MNTQLRSVAVATTLLSLSPSALTQSLHFDGLLNSPSGQSTLSIDASDRLVVSNIGSSGQDGVSVAIPCAFGASVAAELDLGTAGFVDFRTDVQLIGAPTPVPIALTVTADGSGAGTVIRPDFSAVGSQTYDLRVMHQGQVVFELADCAGPTLMANFPIDQVPEEVYVMSGDIGGSDLITEHEGMIYCVIQDGAVTPPGSTNSVVADMVEFYSSPSPIPTSGATVEALNITAGGGVHEILVERQQMRLFDAWLSGLGDAHLDTTPTGTLAVSNLGSAAQDGVSITDPDEDDEDDEIGQLHELVATDENGGIVKLSVESTSGAAYSVGALDTGDAWTFTPDFSQLGSPTYTLELYDRGTLVFAQSGMTGPAISMRKWRQFYNRTALNLDGTGTVELCFASGESELASIPGGPDIKGDMFTVRSQVLPAPPIRKCIELRAGGLNADLILESYSSGNPCVGTGYCIAATNSTGSGAEMCASGSSSVSANDLVLSCGGLPTNQFGIFYYGPNQIQFAFGDGFRCVGGSAFRLPVINSGPNGELSYALDNTNPPEASGQITPGSVWNFQCWYRDPAGPCMGFSNLSNGLEVPFTL